MKITIENPTYKQVVSIELTDKDDAGLHELVAGLIIPALLAIGYDKGNVDDYFSEQNE